MKNNYLNQHQPLNQIIQKNIKSLVKKLTQRSVWRKIILLTVMVWILFFVFGFIMSFLSSHLQYQGILIWIWITLGILAFLISILPLCIVVIHQKLRKKLYTLPELTAASIFIGSFLISMFVLIVLQINGWGLDLSSDQEPPIEWIDDILGPIFAGLFIGIIISPFLLGFPAGIPLLCTFFAWMITEENKHISPLSWSIFLIVSLCGWVLTVLIGYAVGSI